MDYKDSGVDKERGYRLVRKIQADAEARATQENVLGGVGGFAALYALKGYEEPVLVSSTDGVGTKLKLAFDFGIYDTVGQDCVAMCTNDVLCTGARPLFFLDYLACDRIDVEIASQLIKGISGACASIGIPLIGGESAEMPGFYNNGLYDMAGFCLGAVERNQIRGKELCQVGDIIIGLSSNGLHSNGFSLVRKILADCEEEYGPLDYDAPLIVTGSGKKNLKELLLQPTTLYTHIVSELLNSPWGGGIHSMAHITGGGIYENLCRAFILGQRAEIDRNSITVPGIFSFIQNPGRYLGHSGENRISDREMWSTFNMGLGFVLVIAEDAAEGILQLCDQYNSWGQELISSDEEIQASIIGRIHSHDNPDLPQVELL
ncbi:MAG: phosphoribosylformylglycinamidine cyclo-ligase [Spirochaetota bacterium]